MIHNSLINNSYLHSAAIKKISAHFKKNDVVQLTAFFDETAYLQLRKKILSLKYTPISSLARNWSEATINLDAIDATLISFISLVIGKPIKTIRCKAITAQWKSYKLMSDDEHIKHMHIIIDFTQDWGDFGGEIGYMKNNGLVTINHSQNSISIINAKKGKMFLKYINHYATTKKRYFIIGEIM